MATMFSNVQRITSSTPIDQSMLVDTRTNAEKSTKTEMSVQVIIQKSYSTQEPNMLTSSPQRLFHLAQKSVFRMELIIGVSSIKVNWK